MFLYVSLEVFPITACGDGCLSAFPHFWGWGLRAVEQCVEVDKEFILIVYFLIRHDIVFMSLYILGAPSWPTHPLTIFNSAISNLAGRLVVLMLMWVARGAYALMIVAIFLFVIGFVCL